MAARGPTERGNGTKLQFDWKKQTNAYMNKKGKTHTIIENIFVIKLNFGALWMPVKLLQSTPFVGGRHGARTYLSPVSVSCPRS